MKESDQLRETLWRRKLSPEEEARLQALVAANPAQQREWDREIALTDHLRQLPDVAVSSNFTAQVMQTLDAELARQNREGSGATNWLFWFRRWAPKLAPVTLALVVGAFSLQTYRSHQYRGHQMREEMARSVAMVLSNPNVLAPEVMEDFEIIQNLPSVTDEDLLAALQ